MDEIRKLVNGSVILDIMLPKSYYTLKLRLIFFNLLLFFLMCFYLGIFDLHDPFISHGIDYCLDSFGRIKSELRAHVQKVEVIRFETGSVVDEMMELDDNITVKPLLEMVLCLLIDTSRLLDDLLTVLLVVIHPIS